MRFLRLFTSHIDAWCITLIAASLPLLIHNAFSFATIYLLLAITAGAWLAFAVNDYFDRRRDRHDPVKAQRNFFVLHPQPPQRALLLFALICLLLLPAFLQFGWRGLAVAAVGVTVMWAYSAEPLRLKSRPPLDLLAHALFVETFPYWSVLFMLGVAWTPLDRLFLTVALLSSFSAQLEQQARDYEVDLRTDRTFTTRFGLRTNMLLLRVTTLLIIIIVAAGTVNGTIPMRFVPLALIALPVMLLRFVRERWRPDAQRLIYLLSLLAAAYTVVLLLDALY